MKKNKSSISKAASYEKIGEFWGSHDSMEYCDEIKKTSFEIDIRGEKIYCALDRRVSDKLQVIASKRGVPPDVLVNLFLQEKLRSIKSKKSN